MNTDLDLESRMHLLWGSENLFSSPTSYGNKCAIYIFLISVHLCLSVVSKLLQLMQVSVEIAAHFAERVAAEFLHHRLREHDRDHGFAGNSSGGNDAHVGALVGGGNGLFGHHVHRAKRSSQRG